MIAEGTKCVIKKAPDLYAHLIGRECKAEKREGARGTGAQLFSFEGGLVFGNADSGFVVEPK